MHPGRNGRFIWRVKCVRLTDTRARAQLRRRESKANAFRPPSTPRPQHPRPPLISLGKCKRRESVDANENKEEREE